jgi:hypothetical protein
MNRFRRSVLPLLCLAGLAAATAFSCATFEGIMLGMKSDPDLIDRGVAAWNEGGPDAGYKYWARIKSAETRNQYLGYIDNMKAGTKRLDEASALKTDDYDALLSAYGELKKVQFPSTLKVDKFRARVITLRARAEEVAEGKVRALVNAGNLALAKETATAAMDVIDGSDRLAGLVREIDAKYAWKAETEAKARQVEADADASLESARKEADQNKKVEAYKRAVAGFANAEALLGDIGQKEVAFAGSSDADRRRLRKKGQDASIEMNRKIKDYAYALKERQGEDFARVPEQKDLGALSDEQIVAFNAQTRKRLQSELNTVKDLAVTAPEAVPAEAIKSMQENVNRMDKVQVEVKKPKEKGKTIMPVMIGLFNPQRQDKDKSRPGVFRGSMTAKTDQWWGMTDIPKSAMNDLVVRVDDDRACKVMSQSGSKTQDLVSRDKKVLNNYPVLNAGPLFQDGLYFLELAKGSTGTYQGEVVIYKAFITRMK